jgi:hypothetical protein
MSNSDPSKALQPASSRALSSIGGQPEGVRSRMTQDALEIARNFLAVPRRTLHKVGDFELCDLDYRQVCLWAEQLSVTPDGVVKMLAERTADEEVLTILENYDE